MTKRTGSKTAKEVKSMARSKAEMLKTETLKCAKIVVCAAQNDEAHTRLLLAGAKDEVGPSQITNNQELITVEQLAEQLVRLEPTSLPHRTLLALARLNSANRTRPWKYSGLNVPPNTASPSALAVHVAVLITNGH